MSNTNTMRITDFLDKMNIKWGYMSEENRNKFSNNMPYNTKFYYSQREADNPSPTFKKIKEYYMNRIKPDSFVLSEFNEWYENKVEKSKRTPTGTIAYQTTQERGVIDIDSEVLSDKLMWLRDECPYALSRNKRLPHFFIIPNNLPPNAGCRTAIEKIDVLTGNAGMLKSDELVHLPADWNENQRYEVDVKKMTLNLFGEEKVNRKWCGIHQSPSTSPNTVVNNPREQYKSRWENREIMKHLNALPDELKTDRDDWLKISTYMKKVGLSKFQWVAWSMSCPKYQNNPPPERDWDTFRVDDRCGDEMIIKYHYTHNRPYWNRNFSPALKFKEYAFLEDTDKDEEGRLRWSKNKPLNIPYTRYLRNTLKMNSIIEWAEEENLIGVNNDEEKVFTNASKVKRELIKRQQKYLKYIGQYIVVIKGAKTLYISLDYNERGRIKNDFERKIHKSQNDAIISWSNFIGDDCLIKVKKTICECGIGDFNPMKTILKKFKYCKIYNKMDFLPSKYLDYDPDSNDNIFNLWTGWEYIYQEGFKVDMELIEPIIKVFKMIFNDEINVDSEGDRSVYEYMMKIFKMILCGKKTGIATSIWSELQGAGKNAILEFFGLMLLGERYTTILPNLDAVLEKFNGLMCGRSFVIIEELDRWGKDKTKMNKLKCMITNTVMKKELKCIDAEMVKDHCNYFFLSNYKGSLPPEGKNDRRMNPLEAGCAFAKGMMESQAHLKFWSYIHTLMGSRKKTEGEYTPEEKKLQEKVREHFFHYIMSFDLKGFNPEHIIKTKDRVCGEEGSCPILVRFFRCLLDKTDTYQNYPKPNNRGKVVMKWDYIWSRYCYWLKITGEGYENMKTYTRDTASQLSKALCDKIPEITRYGGNTIKGENTGFIKSLTGGYRGWSITEDTINQVVQSLERKYSFNQNCYIELKNYMEMDFLNDTDEVDDLDIY